MFFRKIHMSDLHCRFPFGVCISRNTRQNKKHHYIALLEGSIFHMRDSFFQISISQTRLLSHVPCAMPSPLPSFSIRETAA
jgi:hypothetical protein